MRSLLDELRLQVRQVQKQSLWRLQHELRLWRLGQVQKQSLRRLQHKLRLRSFWQLPKRTLFKDALLASCTTSPATHFTPRAHPAWPSTALLLLVTTIDSARLQRLWSCEFASSRRE